MTRFGHRDNPGSQQLKYSTQRVLMVVKKVYYQPTSANSRTSPQDNLKWEGLHISIMIESCITWSVVSTWHVSTPIHTPKCHFPPGATDFPSPLASCPDPSGVLAVAGLGERSASVRSDMQQQQQHCSVSRVFGDHLCHCHLMSPAQAFDALAAL